MSASTFPLGDDKDLALSPDLDRPHTLLGWIDATLSVLASLKVTVALLALGIFIVLVGTLAQVEQDIWQVVPQYFRSWIMWVDINLFFPPSFFPPSSAASLSPSSTRLTRRSRPAPWVSSRPCSRSTGGRSARERAARSPIACEGCSQSVRRERGG